MKKLDKILTIILVIVLSLLSYSLLAFSETKEFTIKEAIEFALENNLELELAKREQDILEREERIGDRRFNITVSADPSLSIINEKINYGVQPVLSIDGAKDLWGGEVSGQLNLSQDIISKTDLEGNYTLNFRRSLLKSSEQSERHTNITVYDNAKQELKDSIINLFFSVLLKAEEINLSKDNLALKNHKLQGLKASLADEKLIEQVIKEIEFREKNIVSEQKELNEYLSKLKELLGLPLTLELILEKDIQAPLVEKDLDYYLDFALANSNDIIHIKDSLKKAKEEKQGFIDANWNADLIAGLNQQHFTVNSTLDPNYYLQINISRSLDFVSSIEQEKQELEIARAELNFARKKAEVIKQINDAFLELEEAQLRIEQLQTDLLEIKKDFNLLEKKFELGLISSLELMEGEYRVKEMELEIFRADLAYISQVNNFFRLSGLNNKWPLD